MNGHDAASQKARAGAHAGHVHGSAKPLQNGFSCTDVCTETEVRRGMRITFKDLTYTVRSHHNKKVELSLLTSISGFFNPGQMSALMGPSGSGKTTLLDVLAGRKTSGRAEGSVLFAGVRASSMFLRRYTGYVEQFDTLVDVLTVEEMLMYTAELKRPLRESTKSKKQAVDALVEDLNLAGCRATRIGNSMHRGISGGQCKRTNIGIALITNPCVLFMDEPTAGLDSYTSNEVMTVVKKLVQSGMTLCATINSPTPYAFRLFDRMLLLLGGRVIYFGDQGHQAIEYFRALPLAGEGLVLEALEEGNNEAEWLVDLTTQADRQGRAPLFAGMYEGSSLKAENDRALEGAAALSSTIPPETLAELAVQHATVTPFWWGLWVMLRYRTRKNYTTLTFLGPRMADKLVLTVLMTLLYRATGRNYAQDNLYNISAVLYMWATLPAFGSIAFVPALVIERPLFTRERSDGLYRVITYLCAKMLDELIVAAVVSFFLACILFYGINFPGELVLFWLVYLTSLAIGIVLAYFVAASAPSLDIACAVLPCYAVSQLFFLGFLIRQGSMPAYWGWWAPYIDFMRYAFFALMANEFEGRPDVLLDGVPVLEFYDITDSKWAYLGYEALFFAAFFCLAFLALSFCKHSRR